MTCGEARMDRQADIHTLPLLDAPQLTEGQSHFAAAEGVMTASQQVDSGYSSIASSQSNPQSSQDSQAHVQLQSFSEVKEERAVATFSLNGAPPSPLKTPGGGRIHEGDAGGVREEMSKSPISQSAPPAGPAHPAHPLSISRQQEFRLGANATSSMMREIPTTPKLPNIGMTSSTNSGPKPMTAPPSISPPLPSIAGSKRTSSGVVKTAASVPNSPTGMATISPVTMGLPVSPRIDPSRIQELSAQLRTRLKYARIKVDNNWTTKSLDQVESIYHSNQNSPARGPSLRRDNEAGTNERDDGLSAFGPPIHQVRRQGHNRTASEPMNHFHHGGDGAKTYESFWKERAPFTKMLEKLTGSGQPVGSSSSSHYQHPHQQQYQQNREPQYGVSDTQYPSLRSPARGSADSRQYPPETSSSGTQMTRPLPALTPSNSNLSNYSATYNDAGQPPATPRQPSHHGHPSLSRETSSKSAEEEAVESLMFLMSSPGTTATPRREPRLVQGYQVSYNGGTGSGRRSSLLRENSGGGWSSYSNGDVDLDVTDAEEAIAEEDENDELPPLPRRGEGNEVVNLRRRSDGHIRYATGNTNAQSRVKIKASPHQERIAKAPSGKKKLGVGGSNGNQNARRLAPGFTPT